MAEETYLFAVAAEDMAAAGRGATSLGDALAGVDGVLQAERHKADMSTMDMGTIVSVIAQSGATLALAKGLADWLRARRGVTVKITRRNKAGSITAVLTGLDPKLALDLFDDTACAGDQPDRIRETPNTQIRQRRASDRPATDLLVYYVGHGVTDDVGQLSMLVRRSRAGLEAETMR